MGPNGVHAWPIGRGAAATARPGTVASIMSAPLVTAEVDTSVEDALALMRARDVHHLLLTDRGVIVALVSDRNLARSTPAPATRDEEHRRARPVFRLAQYHLVTIHPDATIEEAATSMLVDGVSSLPVVNGAGEMVGILTSRDLLRHLARSRLRAAS